MFAASMQLASFQHSEFNAAQNPRSVSDSATRPTQ